MDAYILILVLNVGTSGVYGSGSSHGGVTSIRVNEVDKPYTWDGCVKAGEMSVTKTSGKQILSYICTPTPAAVEAMLKQDK